MAFSALLSCVTPTTALRIRIVRICRLKRESVLCYAHGGRKSQLTTAGSTKAVQSSLSSNKASTKDRAAEARRMRTSWSLNCSKISSHMGVGGSSARASNRVSIHRQCSPQVFTYH